MIRTFEGIRVFTLNTHRFNLGSAITIPGIGIFLGLKQINNKDLLRHEFGHILQKEKKGFMFFWFRIAPVSLMSALRTTISKKHIHMFTWTEWSEQVIIRLFRTTFRLGFPVLSCSGTSVDLHDLQTLIKQIENIYNLFIYNLRFTPV